MNARRHSLALAAVVAPLTLALVACGGDDGAGGDDASGTGSGTDSSAASPSSAAPSTPATPDDTPTDTPTTGAPSGNGAGAGDQPLVAAARTGLGAVDGTLFTVDRDDDGGWEVSVVAADGTESDVSTSADGTPVTRGPVVDRDDDDNDGDDDLAERQRLLQEATVTWDAALATAVGEVAGVPVDGLDLDLDAGRATWEVQLGEDTADEQTVVVDAVSGEVLRVERDD